MKSQLDQAKKHLEEQEKKLSEFKLANNGELPQQETALAHELSQLQVQLQGNQDALTRAGQNKITIESSLAVAQSTEATMKRLLEAANDLNTPPLPPGAPPPEKKTSKELEEELAQLLLKYTPRHPDVRALKLAIDRAKGQDAKKEAAEAEARARLSALSGQLTAINAELKTRQAEQQKILSQVASVQSRLRHLPMREQEMAEVTRDYEMSKANYKSLQDKIFAADMATEME